MYIFVVDSSHSARSVVGAPLGPSLRVSFGSKAKVLPAASWSERHNDDDGPRPSLAACLSPSSQTLHWLAVSKVTYTTPHSTQPWRCLSILAASLVGIRPRTHPINFAALLVPGLAYSGFALIRSHLTSQVHEVRPSIYRGLDHAALTE